MESCKTALVSCGNELRADPDIGGIGVRTRFSSRLVDTTPINIVAGPRSLPRQCLELRRAGSHILLVQPGP